MCNWKKWIWPGILATVLLTALAMLMQAETIEQDLTAKAGTDLGAQHSWASVEMDGRDATLMGVAPSEAARDAAMKIADDAYDVRVVGDGSTLLAMADPFTTTATKADDKIVLDGNVASEASRADIIAAAKSAAPGAEIVDNMTLARGAPAGFAALAGYGISQLTGLESGSSSLSNMDLTVKGVAPSSEVYNGVNTALTTLPEGGKLAMADITAPSASPYTLTATKSADAIVLEGYYPSEDVRAAIVAAAEKANPGKTVTDNMEFSLGNPDGFGELAGFGIGQLTGLTSGTASISDLALGVKGIAPTSSVYGNVTGALAGTLPAGGSLAMADITPPTADPYTFEAVKGSDSIVLGGFVPSDAVRSALVAEAEKAFPGKTVVDNMNTALGAPAGFADLAGFGVSQLTTLESGTASTNNSDLTVKGIASSSKVYEGVTSALNGSLPGSGKLAMADITTPTASPYTLLATKSSNQVVLEGYYPSSTVRAGIVAAAEKSNPGKKVVDNLQFALGAPAGYGALAGFGIGQLTTLESGTAATTDSDLTVKGVASSSKVYEDVTSALNGTLPGSGKLAMADITTPTASPYTLLATKSSDQVVLEGYYPSSTVRSGIVDMATKANPGKKIVDNLKFALGAPEGFKDLSDFGIGQLTELKTGSASLSNSDLTVKGLAGTISGYNGVNAALDGTLPGNGKLAMKEITPPSADPYVLSATETAAGITLQGYIPDEATRARVIDVAKAATPTAKVTDQMQIASGAPAGFGDLADFGVSQLKDLTSGEASLSNLDLSVKGISPSQAEYTKVTGVLAGSVPSKGKVVLADISRHTVSPYVFTATKSPTSIVLSGLVENPEQQKAVVADAKAKNPGVQVTDNLTLAKGVADGVDWPTATALAIDEISQLKDGKASITNDQYMVEGMAMTNAKYDSVVSEANGTLPGGIKLSSEKVRRPPVSPYIWSLTNMEGSQTALEGYVPDDALNSSNESQVKKAISRASSLSNSLQIGAGAPKGFAAATSIGIDEVSNLLNGKANIKDTVLMVSGEAKNEAEANQIRARIENSVPAGFTGKHAITFKAPPPAPKPKPKPKPKPVDLCQVALTDEMKSNKINFETNKAIINESSNALLDRLVAVLQKCPGAKVEIGGHTDSRGSKRYNQKLSEARASAVLDYLAGAGIAVNGFTAVGYGEDQPIADNATEDGKAANRRIEFNVTR